MYMEGEILSEKNLLNESLKVSVKPETYSIKRPSVDQIREAIKLLVDGKISQVALFYPRKNIVYHVYRDRKGKYYVVNSSEKKPVKKEVEPDKIDVNALIERYGQPYELLLFK